MGRGSSHIPSTNDSLGLFNGLLEGVDSVDTSERDQKLEDLYERASFIPEISTAYGKLTLAAQDDSVSYEEYIQELDRYIQTLKSIYERDQNSVLWNAIILYEKAERLYQEGISDGSDLDTISEADNNIARADAEMNKYVIQIQSELIQAGQEGVL